MLTNAIFSADWHIYNHKARKISEIMDCVSQLCDYAVEHKVPTLIFGGDLLERKYYTGDVFEPVAQILKKISRTFEKVIVVEGNHEMIAGGNSLLRPWEILPNVVVITDYQLIENVAFAPYPVYDKTLQKYLKQAIEDKAKAFVSHFPLTGAVVKGGHKLSGFSISQADAKRFKLVLLGDIHEFQKIDPNIYYSGSLTQLDFGETPSKGFIHVKDWKVNFIPTSFQELKEISVSTISQLREVKKEIQDPAKVKIRTTNKLLEPELKGLVYVVDTEVENQEVRLQITKDTKYNEVIDKYVDYVLAKSDLDLDATSVKALGYKYISAVVGEKAKLHNPRRVDITFVSIANFRSISALELHLGRKKGLVLVDGVNQVSTFSDSNGAGKSSLYEAIIWGLFGVSVNGSVLSQLVKDGQDYMGVELHFKVKDRPETFRLRRSWTNGKSDLKLSVLGDMKMSLSGLRIAETQEKVFELTGLDYNMFINSVFFSSELVMPFVNYGDSERKKMITNALDTTPYLEAQKLVKSDQQKLVESLSNLKSSISETQIEISEKQKHIEYVKKHRVKLKKQKKTLLETIRVSKVEIEELKQTLQEIEASKEGLDKLFAEEREIQKIISSTKQELRHTQRNLESQNKFVTTQVASLREVKDQLDKLSFEVCTCCGQKIQTSEAIAKIKQREKHLKEQVQNRNKILKSAVRSAKKMQRKISEFQEQLEKLQDQLKQVNQKIEEFDFDEKSYKGFSVRLTYLETKVSMAERNLAEIKKELSEKVEHVSTLETRVKKLKAKIANSLNKIDQIQNMALPIVRFWVDGFSKTGIISFLLDPIANTLNAAVTEYNRLLTDDQIKLRFVTQVQLQSGRLKDSFAVEVENTQGGSSRKSSSQGEKRRIDLCTIWAIRDLFEHQGFSINVEFYDEVLDSLDYEGIQRVLKLLKDHAYKYNKLVFLSSHDANVLSLGLDFLDYRATMVKTKGGSVLKWN